MQAFMHVILRSSRVETSLELPPGECTDLPHALGGLCRLKNDSGLCVLESVYELKVSGIVSPSHVPRLLLPGDVVDLGNNAQLEVPEEALSEPVPVETAYVVKALMAQGGASTGILTPKLVCLTGKDMGMGFPLGEPTAVIGRQEDVQVRIRDRSVSRRHALLVQQEGKFWIEDLDSPNGIRVNGRTLRKPVALGDGDTVELGRTLLRVRVPGARLAQDEGVPRTSSTVPLTDRHSFPCHVAVNASTSTRTPPSPKGLLASHGFELSAENEALASQDLPCSDDAEPVPRYPFSPSFSVQPVLLRTAKEFGVVARSEWTWMGASLAVGAAGLWLGWSGFT